jgi:putative heme-binding domain-containing protein
LLLAFAGPVYAQRELKDIPVPDPVEELKTFTVADGFEVNLFAADPQMHKPIQINFDPQGRLWIAASEVYPQIAPGQVANDKILVLEDRDGDGVADRTTVFADGLLIPTGVAPGDGGAYVANSTELLHLKDTDGDGKADQSRIMLSGFGTEDTHHIIHTFRWGPECLFYMNQSIYIHSHVETPFGVRRLNAGGIWQFRPETLRLDVLARGWVNTWGHAFDRWGQSFVTDGAGGEGINYMVPGAAYPTAYGVAEILHGLNPGSPKYCGLEIVDGRHLPDDWQGSLITHDFRGHRVCRFVVQDEGSGYASIQQPDVISSTHVAFRPIDVKQGPDGALYIADWYNPIIQHGEVDFRDPRRDHVHGRIWRVTAKNRPLVPRPKLVDATIPELLDQLMAPESYTRQHAKRVLKERGKTEVVPQLDAWVARLNPQDPEFEHQRLEALWLYQAHDHVRADLLKLVLNSPTPQARAAAVRVVPHWAGHLDRPEELLAAAVHDEYPRVRLEAVRALAAIPTQRAAELALAVVDHPRDGFLDYAARQTARELRAIWLPAVARGAFDDGGKIGRLIFAIEAAEGTELIPQFVARLERNEIPVEDRARVLELIGALGAPAHLRLVLDRALAEGTEAAETAELLRALLTAQRRRNTRPEGELSGVTRLLSAPQPDIVRLAAECLGLWKLAAAVPALQGLATSAEALEGSRLAAVQALAEVGGATGRETLQTLAAKDPNETVSAMAVAALVPAQPEVAAGLAVQWLNRGKTPELQGQILQAFLQKQGAPDLLAKALGNHTLPEDAAKIALRTVTGSGRQEPALAEALAKAGNIRSEPKLLSAEEMAALLAEIRDHGDPARGEAIFRRHDLSCFKCHAIGGAGGKVGPDLISIGASAQPDYLVDSLLNPNKNVKEGYQTVVVVTDEGKVISGVKVRTSDTALILRDAEDQEIAVPLASIEEEKNGSSLMPVGLTDKLTRSELIDLVRFLSVLGKPGDYAINPTIPVVRTWAALQPTDQSYHRLVRTSDSQLMADDSGLVWNPVYATVAGSLPVEGVPSFGTKIAMVQSQRAVAFLRTSLQVAQPGPVTLRWNDMQGLQVWVDRQPVDPAKDMTLTLEPGRHLIAVSVDLRTRKMPLRLELAPGTTGVQFVGP